jgi:large subunit ribosomal protein L22
MADEKKEAIARLRHLRITPRKVRLIADLVRGMDVQEAVEILRFTPKRAALPLAKLIKSAAVSAENEHNMDPGTLYVKAITVDGGPTLKRFIPRSMGRANSRLKRSSHITVILSEKA